MISPSKKTLSLDREFEKLFEYKKEGIIDLSVGQPFFDTDEEIKREAFYSLDRGNVRYSHPQGKLNLRKAIAEYYRVYGLEIDERNVIISIGGKGAIYTLMQTYLDPNDEVIIQSPGWVSYKEIAKLALAKPILTDAYNPDEFIRQVKEKYNEKVKMIIFSNPSNPLGDVFKENQIKELVEFAVEKDILLVSDEPYNEIIFDSNKHVSAGKYNLSNVVVINSFSKTFNMSGWRIGYGISNKEIIDNMKYLQLQEYTSVPPFIQDAAYYALKYTHNKVEKRREIYEKRRNLFHKEIAKEIKREKPPEGTFYYFCSTENLGIDGKEFAKILYKYGVLCVPGELFGTSKNFVRFSFAKEEEELKIAIERINSAVSEIVQ